MSGREWMVAAGLLLASCSGGGGGDPTTQTIIDRSGVYIDTISGFGSVIVGGVRFETDRATIQVDDRVESEQALRVGQRVVILGQLDPGGESGTATSIVTDPVLKGVVQTVDAVSGRLSLLNTDVRIDADTLISPEIVGGLPSIIVGDRLEIHGARDASGLVLATRIDQAEDSELEVFGLITTVDTVTERIEIGSLSIGYGDAELLGFQGAPAVGDALEAEGESFDGVLLVAQRLERESADLFDSDDEGIEIEIGGAISRFTSATDFSIGQTRITTETATEYEGGAAADLREGVSIAVEGRVNGLGVLVAEEVAFRRSSDFKVEAVVEAVNGGDQQLTVLGLLVSLGSTTQLVDESDAELREFSLDDIAVGDFVEIRGVQGTDTVSANLVKRKSAEDTLKLEGRVTEIAQPDIRILGTTIQTNAATEFEVNDQGLEGADFFEMLSIGDRIEVEGQSPTAGILVAGKVEG